MDTERDGVDRRKINETKYCDGSTYRRERNIPENGHGDEEHNHLSIDTMEEGLPFLINDEKYHPRSSRNNSLMRIFAIADVAPTVKSFGSQCSCKSALRCVIFFLILSIGFTWMWILVQRSYHNELHAKFLNLLHESAIHPKSYGTLEETWNVRPSQDNILCPLIYSFDSERAKNAGLNLLKEELELLGTLAVRICKYNCTHAEYENHINAADHQVHDSMRCDNSSEMVELFSEILRGAHVVIDGDNGWFYAWFRQMQDSYTRTSSHYSPIPMYGIPEGKLLRTVLTGVDVFRDSWFQFEGEKWDFTRHPFESMIHAMNYLEYIITGKQVGPLGKSFHTDSRPIRVLFDGCV